MSQEIRLRRRGGQLITIAEWEGALAGLHMVRPAAGHTSRHAEVRDPAHAQWIPTFELWRGEVIVAASALAGVARDRVNDACLLLCQRLDAAMTEVDVRAEPRVRTYEAA